MNQKNQEDLIKSCQSGVHIITVDTNTTTLNTVVLVEQLPSGCIILKQDGEIYTIKAFDKDKNPLHIGTYNDNGILINVPKLEANDSNIILLECKCIDNNDEEEGNEL